MLDRKYFARNADGSLKTKQPCETPGCNYPNYHVCLVGKENNWNQAMKRSTYGGGRPKGFVMDESQRENIRAAMVAKFAARNAATKERDKKILAARDRGVAQSTIAAEFSLSVGQVRGVLARRESILA